MLGLPGGERLDGDKTQHRSLIQKKKLGQEALKEWLEILPTAEDYIFSWGFGKWMTPSVW